MKIPAFGVCYIFQNAGIQRALFPHHISTFWWCVSRKYWRLEGPFFTPHQYNLAVLRIYAHKADQCHNAGSIWKNGF